MPESRQQLLAMLARLSFRLGEFKLSSGATSDYYVDCRTTTLDAEGARLTGRVFSDEIRKQGWKPDAIGGMTLGADPIVVAVALGYLIFGDFPNAMTWTGIAIIVSSGLYIIHRERMQARLKSQAAAEALTAAP